MALRSASDAGETPFDGRLLSPVIGLEIRGLRLDGPLTKAVVAGLKAAFLRHHVLVIRGQHLTPEQQIAFAEAMGEPDIYPFVAGIDGYPVITPVIKEPEETQNFGGVWHTDTAYLKCPPAATMLLAREIPPIGGDTLFASQVAAYEALSDGMKALLAPLRGLNTSAKANQIRTNVSERRKRESLEAVHPVVRTHPETGAKALYVNAGHTVKFDGMTEAESAPLLDFLFAHQVQSAFTCRVRWEQGTLVIWDNRASQHFPLNDYQGHRREMHRITLMGDAPF